MPQLAIADSMFLYIGTLSSVDFASIPAGRYPLPMTRMVSQITSDRLSLAGQQIQAGDQLILNEEFRSAISRHYYSMYHAARAIVFADNGGDDFQKHFELPRHLPSTLQDASKRETQLTNARLLRNQADYDPYPAQLTEWEPDARALSVIASEFVSGCEDFALTNGHI
jgi:uncharacterized protein (UPF0332 family)